MVRALETKFLLFWAGQEQDTFPERFRLGRALSLLPSLARPSKLNRSDATAAPARKQPDTSFVDLH